MIELESMAVAMPEVEGHPNRAGFRGVLTVVDGASQRAPSGSKGHRVVLTRGAAEAALPSLLGMALDYVPSFDRHDQRRKVGVITSAEIVGRSLEVGGFLYAKDFPDVVEEIAKAGRRPAGQFPTPSAGSVETPTSRKSGEKWGTPVFVSLGGPKAHGYSRQALAAKNAAGMEHPALGAGMQGAAELRRGESWRREGARLRASLAAAVERIRGLTHSERGTPREESDGVLNAEAGPAAGAELGMSYEVADVLLADTRARVWVLTKVTFTGAAILRRDKAAYQDTWIELS